MAASKKRPAVITIYLGKGEPETHSLADFTDWTVIFEDVLEVKTLDHTYYYPLGTVRKWTVAMATPKLRPVD